MTLLFRRAPDGPSRSRRSRLFAALLFAAATACSATVATRAEAAATPPATSSAGPLFGVHPVQQGRTTLPGGHFSFALAPGGHITDAVVVENFSGHPINFHIYGADLVSASGGGLAPAQPSDAMHEVGAWIAVATPHVTIPAHGKVTDSFSLSLPAGVPAGEHLGAVVASASVGTTAQGSTVEARTALIVVVTVPGTLEPSATLSPLRASTADPTQLDFNITLSNTGNVLLTYTGFVSVHDDHGRQVAVVQMTPADAYVVPAGKLPLHAFWEETIPQSGTYRAQATVTIFANGEPVGTLTSQFVEVRTPTQGLSYVVAAALASGLMLLLVSWLLVRRQARRRKAMEAPRRRVSRGAATP